MQVHNRFLREVKRYGAAVYQCDSLAQYSKGNFPPATSAFGFRNVWVDGHAFISFPELQCENVFQVPREHEGFADLSCALIDRTGSKTVLVGNHFLDDTLIEELSDGLTLPNAVIRTNGQRAWLAYFGHEKAKVNPRPLRTDEPLVLGLSLNYGW